MCGILAHFAPGSKAVPESLGSLRHRGPDSEGTWASQDGTFWLGHTRLAIVDLSREGAQPMRDERSGNVVGFNGEIYNHLELRRRLQGSGRAWKGTSDTETLLVAYAAWGTACLGDLKGMFAFVLYEAVTGRVVAGRDRLGIKPLYYCANRQGVRFSSEIRPLIRHVGSVPSRASLAAYLKWGASPEGRLIFPGIQVLPAGHWMEVDREGAIAVHRYWPERPFDLDAGIDPVQGVRRRLEKSVEEHLLADVPVASFLSGGIDSSIITALAAQRAPGKLQTLSVSFRGTRFDEAGIAEEVARRFGTEHHRIDLDDADVLRLVEEAVNRFDIPSVDAINTYIVCSQTARRGIKVALSGLGGDELFGGYPSFRDVGKLRMAAMIPQPLRPFLPLPRALRSRITSLPAGDASLLARWRRQFWSNSELATFGLEAGDAFPEPAFPLRDDFARVSWAELTGYMRHLLLRDSDQMSMAVSLELRVPFLDHELVEFVLGLPRSAKKRFGPGKGLLIEAFRDLLPPAVYQRPKQGFELPMRKWMKGPLQGFVEDGLQGVTNYLPEAFVMRSKAQFEAGKLHWTRLWSMVVLGHFLRKNISI